ncbi:hypothetical protein GCM10027193_06520 [Arenimonas aestuarii]
MGKLRPQGANEIGHPGMQRRMLPDGDVPVPGDANHQGEQGIVDLRHRFPQGRGAQLQRAIIRQRHMRARPAKRKQAARFRNPRRTGHLP